MSSRQEHPIQTTGFWVFGVLSVVLAVLKLTVAGHWSWWRVMLPTCITMITVNTADKSLLGYSIAQEFMLTHPAKKSLHPMSGRQNRSLQSARAIERVLSTVMLIAACAAPCFGGQVYFNDFKGAPGTVYPEWTSTGYTSSANRAGTIAPGSGPQAVTSIVSPSGTHFLGEFGGPMILTARPYDPLHFVRVNETVTLTLHNLKPHSQATVAFDLYILKSWDGNNPNYGPDRWNLSVQGGPVLLDTTFSNNHKKDAYNLSLQNYPLANSAPQTGAAAVNSLGYKFYGDSTYHLTFTFAHTSDTLAFNFSSSLLEGKGTEDESWGLNNVLVSTDADEPIAGSTATKTPTRGTRAHSVPQSFVGVQGAKFVYQSNNITLYGSTFYPSPIGGTVAWHTTTFPAYIDQIISRAQQAGQNILRPTGFWDKKTPNQNPQNPVVWANMDYLISASKSHGMFVLMDISAFKWLLMANGQNVTDPNNWNAFIDFVAARYQNEPTIAFWSIMGEPTVPATPSEADSLVAFYDAVTTRLRSDDPNHLICAGAFNHMEDHPELSWWQRIYSLSNNDIAGYKTYSQNDLNLMPSITNYTNSINKPAVDEEFGMPQSSGDCSWSGISFNGMNTGRADFF